MQTDIPKMLGPLDQASRYKQQATRLQRTLPWSASVPWIAGNFPEGARLLWQIQIWNQTGFISFSQCCEENWRLSAFWCTFRKCSPPEAEGRYTAGWSICRGPCPQDRYETPRWAPIGNAVWPETCVDQTHLALPMVQKSKFHTHPPERLRTDDTTKATIHPDFIKNFVRRFCCDIRWVCSPCASHRVLRKRSVTGTTERGKRHDYHYVCPCDTRHPPLRFSLSTMWIYNQRCWESFHRPDIIQNLGGITYGTGRAF